MPRVPPAFAVVAASTLVAVVALASSRALAQADAGHCEAPDGGTVTLDGNCANVDGGSQAVFCTTSDPTQGTVARLPCSDFALNGGTVLHGACNVLSGIGAWCTFPEGSPCVIGDGAGGSFEFACGFPNEDDATFGCDEITGCTDLTPFSFVGGTCAFPTPLCRGNHLRTDCTSWSQSVTIDCASLNGICDPNAQNGPKCVNGLNGRCDNALLTCAGGLSCINSKCRDPANPTGEGEGEGAAGEGEGAAGEGEGAAGEGEGAAGEGEGAAGEGEGAAGEGEGAPGEGEGEPGVGLGNVPDAGVVSEQPLETSGCACGTSSPAEAALVGAVVCAAALRRRRRNSPAAS